MKHKLSDETIISQMHEKPVFVTHYPRAAKAFYMKADRTNEKVVLNFDLLAQNRQISNSISAPNFSMK